MGLWSQTFHKVHTDDTISESKCQNAYWSSDKINTRYIWVYTLWFLLFVVVPYRKASQYKKVASITWRMDVSSAYGRQRRVILDNFNLWPTYSRNNCATCHPWWYYWPTYCSADKIVWSGINLTLEKYQLHYQWLQRIFSWLLGQWYAAMGQMESIIHVQ